MLIWAAVFIAATGTNPPDCKKFSQSVARYALSAYGNPQIGDAERERFEGRKCEIELTANISGYTERIVPSDGCTPSEVVAATKALTGVQYDIEDWKECTKGKPIKILFMRGAKADK